MIALEILLILIILLRIFFVFARMLESNTRMHVKVALHYLLNSIEGKKCLSKKHRNFSFLNTYRRKAINCNSFPHPTFREKKLHYKAISHTAFLFKKMLK